MLFEAQDVVSGYGALQVLNGVSVEVEERRDCVGAWRQRRRQDNVSSDRVWRPVAHGRGASPSTGPSSAPFPSSVEPCLVWDILPEGRGIFQNLTVRENLDLGLGLRSDGADAIRRDRDRLLDLLPALSREDQRRCVLTVRRTAADAGAGAGHDHPAKVVDDRRTFLRARPEPGGRPLRIGHRIAGRGWDNILYSSSRMLAYSKSRTAPTCSEPATMTSAVRRRS